MDAPATTDTVDAVWFRTCVERMADLVCAIDHEGVVVYANPATTTWLGILPEDMVGRNCLDFVHPDDLERAMGTISYGRASERAEVPATFRLRNLEGWETFDVRGHGLGTDPLGETMLLVARESNGVELLDELLDNLAVGGDFARALELIARQLCRQLWETSVGIVYRDDQGQRQAISTDLPPELASVLVSELPSPWLRAMQRGEDEIVHEVASLDPAIGAAVEGAGFGSLFAVPVADPLTREPVCLVIFGPSWLEPDLGFGVAIERIKRLLRVALQQRYHREMLERSARTDALTGLANRRHFFQRLDHEIEVLLTDSHHRAAVVYIDLDLFKQVNDTHGHGAGDQVLREVAARLRSTVGAQGLVARLGGDEFAVLVLDGDPDLVAAAAAAAIAAPIRLREGEVQIGASTGTTRALQGDVSDALVDRADALTYVDKRRRRSTS